MEEKKSITISITTLLLVIAIIIIIMMGYIIYKNSLEKRENSEQISQLNSEIQQLENTSVTSNTTSSTSSANFNTSSTENTKPVSESELKNTFEKYLNFCCVAEAWPPELLIYLGLTTDNEIDDHNTIENGRYILTNVKYEDFENEMLKYITKDFFNERWSAYKNVNGYVAAVDGYASGSSYTITDMILVSNQNDSAIYHIDTLFFGPNDETYPGDPQAFTVVFDLSNDKAVISKVF